MPLCAVTTSSDFPTGLILTGEHHCTSFLYLQKQMSPSYILSERQADRPPTGRNLLLRTS